MTTGIISGTVKVATEDGAPASNSIVRAYDRITGAMAAEVTSDVNGEFSVTVPDINKLYTFVAVNNLFPGYNAGIKDNVAPETVTDPLYGSVILLLKGEGTDGSTTFIDSSSNNYSPDGYTSTNISTSQSKFGSSSIYFQNVNDTRLNWPASTNYNNGESFTLEFWIRLASLPSSTTYCLATSNSRYFTLTSGGNLSSTAWGGANLVFGILSINIWYWCVLVYNKNLPRTSAYLNGTRTATSTALATRYTTTNEKFGIPGAPDISFLPEFKNVYIDELRFTRAARYDTTLTTIPVQTESWPSA